MIDAVKKTLASNVRSFEKRKELPSSFAVAAVIFATKNHQRDGYAVLTYKLR